MHLVFEPVTKSLFRPQGNQHANVAIVNDEFGGTLIEGSYGTYRKRSAALIWSRWLGSVFVLSMWASAILYAFWWGIRKITGRSKGTSVAKSGLPLLATFCFLAINIVFSVTGNNATEAMGHFTIWSAALWLLSWLFALVSVYGVFYWLRNRQRIKADGMFAYVHSALHSLANIMAVVFFWLHGWIGMQPWAC